jgi:hypothetical protein
MAYEKEVLMLAGAGAAGAAQTYLIQKFVEPTQGNWVPQIGGFGRPSALLGIVGGAAAIAAAYLAMTGKIQYIRDPRIQFALLGYGGAALAGGVLAGMNAGGLSASSRAFPRTAAVRAVPAGAGYSMINKRETNIL